MKVPLRHLKIKIKCKGLPNQLTGVRLKVISFPFFMRCTKSEKKMFKGWLSVGPKTNTQRKMIMYWGYLIQIEKYSKVSFKGKKDFIILNVVESQQILSKNIYIDICNVFFTIYRDFIFDCVDVFKSNCLLMLSSLFILLST